MNKIIFHIDINAFFASVEEILNPTLKTKPIGICGPTKKAVLSTCNYVARQYGIKSGMKSYIAKNLCPDIIFINPNHSIYRKTSYRFIDFLKNTYTNKIEVISIDECYMDVTDIVEKYHNNFLILANQIQKNILEKLSLPISIGISDNKILSKIASDIKKPMGIFSLFTSEIQKKLWPMPINNFVGIGNSKIDELNKLNIFTIDDFVNYSNSDDLYKIFKNQYYKIYEIMTGEIIDDVININNHNNKSISKSITFKEELDIDRINKKISIVCDDLILDFINSQTEAYTLSIGTKYKNKKLVSKSITFKEKIKQNQIKKTAKKLFIELWNEEPIIFISVKVSKLNSI